MTTPRASSCTRCRWLRWGLLALAAATGVALLHAATVAAVPASAPGAAASVPAAPASAASSAAAPVPLPKPASAPALAAAPSGAPASAPPDLRLVYKTVVLPSGRLGGEYGPRVIVRGGRPPYAFTVEGKFPPGLDLADDGTLAGRPTAAGSHRFTLMVSDASSPPLLTQQAYVLYVAPARTPAASAPPPPLAAIPRDEAAAVVDRFPGVPRSYKLTPAGLAQLAPVPPVEEVVSDDATTAELAGDKPLAAAPAAEPLPTAEQLGAMLAPLLDVEYPTRALFLQAVQAARCSYYQAHVADAALKKGVAADAKCPPDVPPVPPATAAKGRRTVFPAPAAAAGLEPGIDALPLHQFYAELMPPDLLEEVVTQATQHHPLGDAAEIAWSGNGCGCVTPMPGDQVYGFFPFWHASKEVQTLDFSLFARISAMGAVLNDDGVYSLPARWRESAPRFVREARRHGTRVDLVIYRRDWRQLLALPEARLNAFSRLAAANAVAIADARVDESILGLEPLLARFWDAPAHAYDGITVFFEDSPADPEGSRRFARFFRGFMLDLIAEMQRSGRAYRLNVAVPDQLLGDEGPYGFAQLLDYVERAELPRTSKGVEHEHKLRYKGTTDIVVEYLVLLGEPTSVRRKELRAKIDATTLLQGHRRIAFLESAVPVLFHARGEKPAPLSPDEADRLDQDLAYTKWNFGGVGFWPVPVATIGSGAGVHSLLERNYAASEASLDAVCAVVCPNRAALHLLLELLLLATLAALAAYAWNCRVRRLGRRYLLFLWGGALATVLVAFALLSCDPALESWRESNVFLYVLIAASFAAGIYVTFKPRVDPP
jgi:hypothetical protein